MDLGEAVIAIGVGCRKDCTADAVIALVRQALQAANLPEEGAALFTVAGKEMETGLQKAARDLNMPLTFLDPEILKAAAPQTQTRSMRAEELFGVPSVCETAALAGAGPKSRLILPQIKSSSVTCAIAQADHGGARS